jgi:hypothetical protein
MGGEEASGGTRANGEEPSSKKARSQLGNRVDRRTHCHPKGATHRDDVPLHVPLGEAPIALAKPE